VDLRDAKWILDTVCNIATRFSQVASSSPRISRPLSQISPDAVDQPQDRPAADDLPQPTSPTSENVWPTVDRETHVFNGMDIRDDTSKGAPLTG